jgi:arabinogalactan endo-1,4-beta-galactosidase
MRNLILAFIVLCFQRSLFSQSQSDSFIRGVDISFTQQIEDLGGKYKINGIEKDVLDILKDSGVNYIRLRIWHTPINGYCGLEKTLEFARRIKSKGFRFLLDFHYSDSWADPGKQTKPAAWQNLSYEILKDSVYEYSKRVISDFKNQNTLPDLVQVGNEITGGMLWPDGKLYGTSNQNEQWRKFAELVKEGIRGVNDAAGIDSIKIMIHIDRGGDNNGAVYFFDHLIAQNVDFNVIGLSYYPWWHGPLNSLIINLNELAQRYQKEIIVAESAYPWTLQYKNDGNGNIVGQNTTLLQSYPATVKGQKDFLFSLSRIIKDTRDNKGIGFFYWEPAYISVPPIGSSWENLATFDFNGEALESLIAFKYLDSLKSVSVKLRINTSTHGDTITSKNFVQIRGEIKGTSSSLLPDGKQVTWDVNSQLICKNVGGDYWDCQFKMYPGDQLQYKIWTGKNKSTPTYLRLGWEGPILPFDSSNINARLLNVFLDDTTNTVEYFNTTGIEHNQYWSPFDYEPDSIGVLFRVNVGDIITKGLFDTTKNLVSVRGDSISSNGILSWTLSKVLKKEANSINKESFWSGVIYFPKKKISAGTLINYKFFVENSSFGGWESSIDPRSFQFPITDTTLFWHYFNDKKSLTEVSRENNLIPGEFKLFQNYPNPFNPVTTISYYLPAGGKDYKYKVTLKVFNSLGREVETLVNEFQTAGFHSSLFTLRSSLPSGVYFYQIKAGSFMETKKLILLK